MAFRMEKLTHKAQEALVAAQAAAGERGNPELDPLHLLAALVQERDGIAQPVIRRE